MVWDEYDYGHRKTNYDSQHIGNICTDTKLDDAAKILYEHYKKNNPVAYTNEQYRCYTDYTTIRKLFNNNKYDTLDILDPRRVESIGIRISDYINNRSNDHNCDFLDQYDWYLIQTWLCDEKKVKHYENGYTINESAYRKHEEIAEDFLIDFKLQHPTSTIKEHKEILKIIENCRIYGAKILNAFEDRYTTCVSIKFAYDTVNKCVEYFDNIDDKVIIHIGIDTLVWYIVKVWNTDCVRFNERLKETLRFKYLFKCWMDTYLSQSKLLRITYKP